MGKTWRITKYTYMTSSVRITKQSSRRIGHKSGIISSKLVKDGSEHFAFINMYKVSYRDKFR